MCTILCSSIADCFRICALFCILPLLIVLEYGSRSSMKRLHSWRGWGLHVIAVVIKDTKFGQGLKLLPRNLIDLKKKIPMLIKEFTFSGKAVVQNEISAALKTSSSKRNYPGKIGNDKGQPQYIQSLYNVDHLWWRMISLSHTHRSRTVKTSG